MSRNNDVFSSTSAADVVTAEAASWLAQLDNGRLSSADRLALAEWMSRSPRHSSELRRLEATWSSVDTLLDQTLLTRSSPVATLSSITTAWAQMRPIKALAASLIVVLSVAAAAAVLLLNNSSSVSPSAVQIAQSFTHKSPRGEVRVISLDDGSIMYLNSNGIAEVRYTDKERQIRLLNGEALFEVTHNPNRPFRVYAGSRRVEAVGTSFMVKLDQHELELTVTQGKVKLDNSSFIEVNNEMQAVAKNAYESSPELGMSEAVISAGQRVVSTELTNVISLDQQAIARHTAWMNAKHIFEGDTLEHVVKEISRHSELQIVVADASLRELRVGGVFEFGQAELFLSTLIESFEVSLKRVDDNLVYLESR